MAQETVKQVAAAVADGIGIPAIPDVGTVESTAGQPVVYDGVLRGLERGTGVDGCWAFEGCGYDTPADEATVMATVGEALAEPDAKGVSAAREFTFGSKAGFTYTSQALLAMLVAYEEECSVDGEDNAGVNAVAGILREAARRIAVVEALTV